MGSAQGAGEEVGRARHQLASTRFDDSARILVCLGMPKSGFPPFRPMALAQYSDASLLGLVYGQGRSDVLQLVPLPVPHDRMAFARGV